jgi:hypothetical protein
MNVSPGDKAVLRDLAKRVAEIAADPVHERKADMWRRHNDLRPARPMVLVFPEGSWTEIKADWQYACGDPWARHLEDDLRTRIHCWEHLRDDNVIEATVRSPIVIHNTGYGIATERTLPELARGAYHIDPVIVQESDIDRIATPEVTVDWEATAAESAKRRDIFDGILRVETCGAWGSYGWAPLDLFATWRGIDTMYVDLVDRPDWVHRLMQRLLDAKMAEIDQLEAQGAMTLNNRNHYNGSGGVGYTNQLPQPDFDGTHVRCADLWAMATAQIFSEVSPDMHWEFALQYEKQFLERFGLSNYGCCEPLHRKLDYVKRIRNLRRVSISPWADIEKSAQELGADYGFSWKPNPAIIAAPTWNPDAVRRSIRDFCAKTRGCVTDITMKDTHTCCNEPHRLSEWVRVALQVAEEFGEGT